MATGVCSVISSAMLSPGITISVPGRQLGRARHVGGAEVELRAVAVEERRVTAAFFLAQDVDFALEGGVRRDRSRLRQDHAALDIFLRDTAEEQARVVARQTLVQLLLEHFDAGDNRLARLAEADDLRRLRRP